MSESNSLWTSETYTFDEIAHKFKFPLLVQVSEGFYTEEDEDAYSFSAGDMIMFDQFVTLQKVAAAFVGKGKATSGKNFNELLADEILLPLNYKGKLKVQSKIKEYERVQELAKDFPRFATVLETLELPVKGFESVTLIAGTQIELDRIITLPSKKAGLSRLLVINTDITGHKQVAVSLDTVGKFRSLPDGLEYTLREAVDREIMKAIDRILYRKVVSGDMVAILKVLAEECNRGSQQEKIIHLILEKVCNFDSSNAKPEIPYGHSVLSDWYNLPQTVCFLDNEILSTYTEDLLEGVEKMTDITTAALEIQKVVQQKVLIGYHKDPDQIGNVTETDNRSTTSLVPLESTEMKEVLVTIYKGDLNRSSCEKLLGSNIKANKRRSMAMAEEGLSMEFVHKPRVIRFPGVSFSELEEIADLDDAPPIPPRTRGYTNRDVKTKPPVPERLKKTNQLSLTKEPNTADKADESLDDLIPTDVLVPKPATSGIVLPTSGIVSPASGIALPTSTKKLSKAYCTRTLPRSYSSDSLRSSCSGSEEPSDGFNLTNVSDNQSQEKTSTLGKLFRSKKKTKKDKDVYKDVATKQQSEQERFYGKQDLAHTNEDTNRKPDDEEHLYEEPDLPLHIVKTIHATQEVCSKSGLKSDITLRNQQKNISTSMKSDTEEAYVDMSGIMKLIPKHDQVAKESRPIAHIHPHSSRPPSLVKEFRLLSVVEVKERLVTCGMPKLADFCFDEKINGAFLVEMDEDTLKSLELTSFQKNKLKKIMSGWVPT